MENKNESAALYSLFNAGSCICSIISVDVSPIASVSDWLRSAWLYCNIPLIYRPVHTIVPCCFRKSSSSLLNLLNRLNMESVPMALLS